MQARIRTPRTRLDPEQRRAQIVEAADRVLGSRDPLVVTFEDIAAEAGVSRALVYNYFGDKGGLLAAVYTHALAELDENLRAALRTSGDDARVHAIVGCYLDFARAHAGTWHILGQAAAAQHPAVQRARRQRARALGAVVGGGPEARLALAALVGLLEAALLNWLEDRDLDEEHLAALLTRCVRDGFVAYLPLDPTTEDTVTPSSLPRSG